MQIVEQHVIDKEDRRYVAVDAATFASKNLYNAANYLVRQSFIHHGVYLSYPEVYHQMKHHEAYRGLPTKVSQQVMKGLDKNWKSYFAPCQAYQEDPSKFVGHPRCPGYKDKQHGRNILVYTSQAISQKALKRGVIHPSGLALEIETKHTNVDGVRIVPRHGYYVVEVVYEQEITQAPVDASLYAAIDIGLNNLATLTSNKVGFVPRMVNGRPDARFISMLTYKCQLVGIQVIVTEESYTSKASFLDMDVIPTYSAGEQESVFSGRRVKRGLYRASGKCYLNADVNGSYNILRKVAPDAFVQGSRGCVVHPLPLVA